jgi:hypothetical protein
MWSIAVQIEAQFLRLTKPAALRNASIASGMVA